MKIIGGPSSQMLTSKVARLLNLYPSIVEYSQFPDKEQYLCINDNTLNEEVIIIQNTSTDKDYMSLLQLIDACDNAKKIFVIIPYMGYSRQDKRFKIGEPISARVIAKSINCDQVYTVNIHDKQILDYFNSKSKNLDASKLISDYIKSLNIKDPFLIAPDNGALNIVETISKYLNCEYDVFYKIRLNSNNVNIKSKNLNLNDRSVFLVDDMISTGETIIKSMKILLSNNVKNVYALCVHPVFSNNSILKLYNSGLCDIITTDSLEKIQSKISISPLISEIFIK